MGSTYIVAEGPDGLYLIDQHAAHERVLYERMVGEHDRGRCQVQPLLEPLVLDLTPSRARPSAPEVERLNELGVGIEPFGGGTLLAAQPPGHPEQGQPGERPDRNPRRAGAGYRRCRRTRTKSGLVTLICKRAAVKGGQRLSLPEMQELVGSLEQCRSPRTCPHGRPTMIHVSADELARQFGRM